MNGVRKDEIESIKKTAKSVLKDEIKQLQLMPSVATKLLNLTYDDNTDINDLAHIIETEPVLAVKILNQVNSAAYSLPNKITSISRAVNMLGFSAVRQLALNQLFYNKLINTDTNSPFNLLYFWQHCLYVASLSKRIAVALRYPDPDLVYSGGLLHDIGKTVLENHGRLTYSDFIRSMDKSRHPGLEEERRFFGITHTEMGLIFCLEWHLPTSITAIVAHHHHRPDDSSPFAEFNTEIAIVSFANYIAWIQGIGSSTYDSHPTLEPYVLELLDIDQLNLESLLQQVDQDMQSAREFYNTQLPGIMTLRATLIKATINLSQVSANQPEHDQNVSTRKASACLTAPHQSLDPDDFIPRTLEAIQDEFAFDRCIMFIIDPKRRSLSASHWRPIAMLPSKQRFFEIDIGNISGRLLTCLREKKAVILTSDSEPNNSLLQRLTAEQAVIVPVIHQNRLIGILYADYSRSKTAIQESLIPELMPITFELGIAMFNARQYDLEKKNAQIDHLSQLFNKRAVISYLTDLFEQDNATLHKVAMGFVDIDKFKTFNDTCGHQAGDYAIKIVADILRSLSRPEDFIGRYGGEEFLFVLQNTDQNGARVYAERIRSEIERRGKIMSERFSGHMLTVSIGITIYNNRFKDYKDMIEVADQAMYRAKNEGRNRVVVLTGLEPSKTANTNKIKR